MKSGPVDNDIELAAAIGRCSNDWAHAEYMLAVLFSILDPLDLTTAVTIFSCFKSTRAHAEVLNRVAAVSPLKLSATDKAALKKTLREYEEIAHERNKIAHNPIGISPEEQELYIMLRRKNPGIGELPYETQPISAKMIDALALRIQEFNMMIIVLNLSIGSSKE